MVSHLRRYLWLPAFLRVRFLGRSFSSLTVPQSYSWSESMVSTFMHTRTTCRSTITQLHRHGRPAATNGRLYRGCLHLDVLEWTMPQSLEDWTHLVGIISTASELCHGHRNERSGSLIRPVDSVRDLGVLIDSGLTLSDHVNKVAALCFFHIRQLRIVRRTLTDEVAHSLVRAFIYNRIDYCNGILASSPKYLTEKLQSVLRVAARLVLRLPSRSPVSTLMRDQLHWLCIESRVKFKLALLAYKSVHGLAPEYLSAYCVPVSRMPGRTHLRSAGQWTMLVPRTKTVTIGPRGFYCSCPSVWNSLPHLFVTSICHWRLSDRNWNFICLLLNLRKSMYI